MKNIANNTMYIAQELHAFFNQSMGLHLKIRYEAF